MVSFPEKMLSILAGIIKALPEQVVVWVKSSLKLFPEHSEQIVTTAVNSSHSAHTRDIIDAAIHAGYDEQLVMSAALAGGAKIEEIARQ